MRTRRSAKNQQRLYKHIGEELKKAAKATVKEVKYGVTSAYVFHLEKEKLDFIVERTNMHPMQVQFLFQLVGGNYERLKQLEEKLKNNFVPYCPSTVNEVERVLYAPNKSNWFKL